jgi:hypothetical protein
LNQLLLRLGAVNYWVKNICGGVLRHEMIHQAPSLFSNKEKSAADIHNCEAGA